MKYQNRIAFASIALAASILTTGCASKIEKANISSSANPQDEITRLETDLKNAQAQDIDVLAFKDYDKSVKYLEEAKKDLAKREDQEEIIDDLRYSRAHLEAAKGTAEYRKGKAPALFEARQAALKAGVQGHPELQKEWVKTDREVIDDAADLSKVKIEKLTGIQNRYVELERKATILTQLGTARSQINGADNDGAKKAAPQSFKTAQLDYANAESVVSTNVRNPAGYQAAVAKSNASSRMLFDVMNTIKNSGTKNLAEATAISMVMQNRQVTDLKNDLSIQREETKSAESEARAKEMELSNKNQALSSARQKVAMQAALERARKEFATRDAEAYQQGGSLLIRLKNVNFASGRADLPSKSIPVLAKVSEVAKELSTELGAASIKVEGHTDSVGGEAKNMDLSEKRANAVATYFKSNGFEEVSAEGYGLSKPLASNKTPTGRAQNRRVDIVITPEAGAKATSAPSTQE